MMGTRHLIFLALLMVVLCEAAVGSGIAARPVSGGEAADLVATQASLVVAPDGLPVMAYFDEIDGHLGVAKCNDPACDGGDETVTTLDGPEVAGSYATLSIGSDNLPVIAYFSSSAGALRVAKCSDPACAEGDVKISTVDSDGVVGLFSDLAVGADGLPVISYFDRDNGDLKVAKCNDLACAGGDETISTVDRKRCVGLFSSIAVPADGLPVVAYYDSTRGKLKIAKCNDPACAGGDEAISIIDREGPGGSFPSLTIDADGLPVVSYYASGRGDLEVLRCNDPACSGGNERVSRVDGEGIVGSYSSIAIAPDGMPVISYHDHALGELKVAKCNDPACADGDETVSRLGVAEHVGSFTSLAIGPEGLPLIAYYDASESRLEVASCANAACSP